MIIESYTIIKYVIDGKHVISQNSNKAITKLIEPINTFNKKICNNKIYIDIYNNSGTTIKNIIYKEQLNHDLVIDLIINDGIIKNINIKDGIKIKTIRKNEKIKIEYPYLKFFSKKSLLIYNFIINDRKKTIYLLSNNK